MNHLTREVRFSLNPTETSLGREGRKNSWASWPRMMGLQPYVKLQATVSGVPEPATGYLCDIKTIDTLIQEQVVDSMADDYQNGISCPKALLRNAWQRLAGQAPADWNLSSLKLLAHPFLSFRILKEQENMILVTQQFEFSASHRLHCKDLSDEENRAMFGKCNHPNGHGHNYVVDVTVGHSSHDDSDESSHSLARLESIVMEQVIDRFDHKHLNLDIDEFLDTNPTVENIARVIWELLCERLPGELKNVRVYETPKTWADYCAI